MHNIFILHLNGSEMSVRGSRLILAGMIVGIGIVLVTVLLWMALPPTKSASPVMPTTPAGVAAPAPAAWKVPYLDYCRHQLNLDIGETLSTAESKIFRLTSTDDQLTLHASTGYRIISLQTLRLSSPNAAEPELTPASGLMQPTDHVVVGPMAGLEGIRACAVTDSELKVITAEQDKLTQPVA
jgi:hypothetical protein